MYSGSSAVVGQLFLPVLGHILVVRDLVGQLLRLVLRLVETLGATRRLAVITLAVAQVSSFLRHVGSWVVARCTHLHDLAYTQVVEKERCCCRALVTGEPRAPQPCWSAQWMSCQDPRV